MLMSCFYTFTMDCTGQSAWCSIAEPSTHSMTDRPDRALAGKLLDLAPAERGSELTIRHTKHKGNKGRREKEKKTQRKTRH